ncbi:hypothetical protein OKW29_000154 [Paraburkholderia sp. CI3]
MSGVCKTSVRPANTVSNCGGIYVAPYEVEMRPLRGQARRLPIRTADVGPRILSWQH